MQKLGMANSNPSAAQIKLILITQHLAELAFGSFYISNESQKKRLKYCIFLLITKKIFNSMASSFEGNSYSILPFLPHYPTTTKKSMSIKFAHGFISIVAFVQRSPFRWYD